MGCFISHTMEPWHHLPQPLLELPPHGIHLAEGQPQRTKRGKEVGHLLVTMEFLRCTEIGWKNVCWFCVDLDTFGYSDWEWKWLKWLKHCNSKSDQLTSPFWLGGWCPWLIMSRLQFYMHPDLWCTRRSYEYYVYIYLSLSLCVCVHSFVFSMYIYIYTHLYLDRYLYYIHVDIYIYVCVHSRYNTQYPAVYNIEQASRASFWGAWAVRQRSSLSIPYPPMLMWPTPE